MEKQIKYLLMDLGRDSIYSAKGHFKASDIRRILVLLCVVGGALISIMLAIFEFCPLLAKILSVMALFLMVVLFVSERDADYCITHKTWGEKYLAFHKRVESLVKLDENISKEDAASLANELSIMNRDCTCTINKVARYLGKRSIEKKHPETDNWFVRR